MSSHHATSHFDTDYSNFNRHAGNSSYYKPTVRESMDSQQPLPPNNANPEPLDDSKFPNFMIWVDGVGGYLVCAGKENLIGQAVPNTPVSIPITGDLDRSHARIVSVDGGHLLNPIGKVSIEDDEITDTVALIHDRSFRLGESVTLRYRKPHAYSTTAVIDFESRHRTYPWSDAVLIAGDTIVLGPRRISHVFCPTWRYDVILVRRDEKWYCRSRPNTISVDGDPVAQESMLLTNSRVESQEFSFSIETVSQFNDEQGDD